MAACTRRLGAGAAYSDTSTKAQAHHPDVNRALGAAHEDVHRAKPNRRNKRTILRSSARKPIPACTRRIAMSSKITLALAFLLAVSLIVPASAAPRTCGSNMIQYDSSGTWTGPYCD